jgi:hypothetical protein
MPAGFLGESGRGAGGKHGERLRSGLVQQSQAAQASLPIPNENEVQPRQVERQRKHIFQIEFAK